VIKRLSLIRRNEGMTPQAFWEHYTGPHAAIVHKMPGLRKMLLSRVVGPHACVWDAVGELWFDDAAAAEHAFADPEIADLLALDRPLFLGQSEVVFVEETTCWPAD